MTIELMISRNRMRLITHHTYSQDWCGVCGRPTDHWGDHDDLLALGLVEYTDDVTHFTNADGRTVHADHETGVHFTGLGRNATYVDEAQRIIHRAYDRHYAIRSSGLVSLVKPVGEVVTRLGRPVKVA